MEKVSSCKGRFTILMPSSNSNRKEFNWSRNIKLDFFFALLITPVVKLIICALLNHNNNVPIRKKKISIENDKNRYITVLPLKISLVYNNKNPTLDKHNIVNMSMYLSIATDAKPCPMSIYFLIR